LASFDIEQAAFAGFGVFRRSPFSPIIWSTLYAVAWALVLIPFGGDLFKAIIQLVNSEGHPDPKAIASILISVAGMLLLLLPIGFVLGGVVPCAVYRAVLRPHEEGFAYLQLGRSEWIVMLVLFVKNVLLALGRAFLAFLTGVLVLLLPFHGVPIRWLFEFLSFLIILWLSLRLSLAGPMSFRDGQFRLFESWTLTRGQDARLFAVAVVIGVICVVVVMIAVCLAALAGYAIWGGPPVTNLAVLESETGPQMMAVLSPLFVLFALGEYLVAILLTPFVNAPWPLILQRLTQGPEATAIASA
jgi:hypothetical protein